MLWQLIEQYEKFIVRHPKTLGWLDMAGDAIFWLPSSSSQNEDDYNSAEIRIQSFYSITSLLSLYNQAILHDDLGFFVGSDGRPKNLSPSSSSSSSSLDSDERDAKYKWLEERREREIRKARYLLQALSSIQLLVELLASNKLGSKSSQKWAILFLVEAFKFTQRRKLQKYTGCILMANEGACCAPPAPQFRPPNPVTSSQIAFSETLYSLRPAVYLLAKSLSSSSSRSWSPWFLSILVDTLSHWSAPPVSECSTEEAMERSRRITSSLLFYILSSPFYSKATAPWLLRRIISERTLRMIISQKRIEPFASESSISLLSYKNLSDEFRSNLIHKTLPMISESGSLGIFPNLWLKLSSYIDYYASHYFYISGT